MRDRSTTDVCSNRPTSTAPPTKLRSAPAPPRRTPHFARGRSETRPQVTAAAPKRSEEHTSELQSRLHLVCRLLLEKKKKKHKYRRPVPQHVIECNTHTPPR